MSMDVVIFEQFFPQNLLVASCNFLAIISQQRCFMIKNPSQISLNLLQPGVAHPYPLKISENL